jgi:hypothetical protein
MGATNLLFGTSAIDQTYDICNILERIAPNVSELQLFRDDDGSDVCMSGKCRVLLIFSCRFSSVFTSLYIEGSVLVPRTFTFSPFVISLSAVCSSLQLPGLDAIGSE